MVVCEEKKGGMDGPVWLMGLTLKGRQMPNCVCVCVWKDCITGKQSRIYN